MTTRAERARRRRARAAETTTRKPLRVLLLTRLKRNQSGGIARSGRAIVAALEAAGNTCATHDTSTRIDRISPKFDLVWHYGDEDLLPHFLDRCRQAKVPLLVNSSFDNTSERTRLLNNRVADWEALRDYPGPEHFIGDVFFAVFSHAAAVDPRLSNIADQLIAVPKLVSPAAIPRSQRLGFADREGILVGEIAKLARSRLTRGIDVGAAIRGLQTIAPVTAYAQYRHAETPIPPDVHLLKRMDQDRFHAALGRFRLVVSLVAHETFAMVPAEAQGAGIPVLFRSMPQSLDEHFGFSAVPFRSVDELVELARIVYHDQDTWEGLRWAGVANANARSGAQQVASLDLALRTLLLRYRTRKAATCST